MLAKINTGSLLTTNGWGQWIRFGSVATLCPSCRSGCLIIPWRVFLRGEKAIFLLRAFWKFPGIAYKGSLCLHYHTLNWPDFKQFSKLSAGSLYILLSLLSLAFDYPGQGSPISQLSGMYHESTIYCSEFLLVLWLFRKKKKESLLLSHIQTSLGSNISEMIKHRIQVRQPWSASQVYCFLGVYLGPQFFHL